MIRDVLQDLRFAVRSARRRPGFTGLVALSLALGIGANGAIFNLVNAVLLRQLPVADPARLVLFSPGVQQGLSTGGPPLREGRVGLYSHPLYERLRTDPGLQGRVLEGLTAEESMLRLVTVERPDQRDDGMGHVRLVSTSYFDVLGVAAHRGRTFVPADETDAGGNPVVVLSHAYWQSRFGGDPAVLGKRLLVNGQACTVVGVAASGFTGIRAGGSTDLWLPMGMLAQLSGDEGRIQSPTHWWLTLVGRLARGVPLAAAEAGANAVLRQHLQDIRSRLSRTDQDLIDRQAVRIGLVPGGAGVSSLRRSFGQPLLALMAGVGLLLVIVCLNVSQLLLARGLQRQSEMGLRAALGATPTRLLRQLLAEGALLAVLGMAIGALATRWFTDGLVAIALTDRVRDGLDVTADARVWSFTAGLGVGAFLLLGLVPAWQLAGPRSSLHGILRGASAAVAGAPARRLVSRALMVGQLALSLVLLVAAGLLAGSLRNLQRVDKGFDDRQVLLVWMTPRLTGGATVRPPAMDDLLPRLTALPQVTSASLASTEILSGMGSWSDVWVPGGQRMSAVSLQAVTPDYFRTVGMTLGRGRSFARNDRPGGPAVAVVNEALASRLFGQDDPLGRRVQLENGPSAPPLNLEIVGLVRDARTHDLREPARPTLFLPISQSAGVVQPASPPALQVRASGDPALLADTVRRTVQATVPDVRVTKVTTMRDQVAGSLREERLLAALSTTFGLAGLLVVALGLYGVVAQWAGQRTREIGVRVALGATAGSVRWLVLRQAFTLVLLGLALGLPCSVAVSRGLQGFLFGLRPLNPPTLLAGALGLFVVAALAAYLPARRASRTDPMNALRSE